MTPSEQLIYNKYIAITRSKQGKPFKLRKDFKGFEKEPAYPHVCKLHRFFNKHPYINVDDFFSAPFEVYDTPGEVYIDYFTTRAAIKTYSLFLKKKENTSPDKMHDSIKESLRFIGMFCLNQNISVSQYLYHMTGCTLSWMQHYKQRHINIYSLFEMGNVIESAFSVSVDERDLFLNETQNNLATYKTRYYNSPSTVSLVREGTAKISTFVENHKTKTTTKKQ